MKKIIVLLFALTLVFTLAACGGNTNPPSNNGDNDAPPASQSDNNTPSGNNGANKVDKTTIAGYLADFEITEDDLKPPNFTRFDTDNVISDGPSKGEVRGINAYVSAALDKTAQMAWIENVLNKMQAMAGSGKIMNTLNPDEELTLASIDLSKTNVYGGNFSYKGKTVNFNFSVSGNTDKPDPDDAMAGATFKINWR